MQAPAVLSRSRLSPRWVLAAGLGLATLAAAGAARADNVQWSLGISAPGVSLAVSEGGHRHAPRVVVAPPVYVQPAPVYVQPAPVYTRPAPVYVRPAPVFVQPPVVVHQPPVWVAQGYGHGHYRDRNHDGIPDRWQYRDRNHDGVPDRFQYRDRNRDGIPDHRQDWNRDGRPDWQMHR